MAAPGDREDDDAGNGALGIEAGETGIGLQGQHHAGEQRRERDDGKREEADFH
jgi:hypothetical protein